MSFITWNVQGVNDTFKDRTIRDLIKLKNAEIICLTETRLQHYDQIKFASLWGNIPFNYVAANIIDHGSEGIPCIWNLGYFSLENNYTRGRWIVLIGNTPVFGLVLCNWCSLWGKMFLSCRMVNGIPFLTLSNDKKSISDHTQLIISFERTQN